MRLFTLILTILVAFPLKGVEIETRDGKRISSDRIEYKKGKLKLDKTTLKRDEIRRIMFTQKERLEEEGYREITPEHLIALKDSALKTFKNEKMITLLDEGYIRLKNDGTRVFVYHFAGVILKPEAKDLAKMQIGYSPESEHFKILLGRTIKKNGKVIYLSPDEVKITKPTQGLEFFDKGYTVSFTIPQAEVGDIVEYAIMYEIYSPWNKKIFSINWNFGGEDAVYYSHYRIVMPDTTYFKKILLNADTFNIKIKETTENSRKIINAEAWKIPAFSREPLMPAMMDIVPRLVGSNQKDWSYIFSWYTDFQKKRMVVTDTLKKLAENIVQGAKSIDDSIAQIYYWVQQNIRYISIKGAAASGVSGHPAEETLKNGYGDCTDKSILFSTLLGAVGIEAYPVYIRTNDGPMLVKEIPSYYGNHAITQVFYPDGTYRFLDATGRWSRYPYFWSADHGVWAICAQKDSIYFIDVPPPEDYARIYSYKLNITPDNTMKLRFYSSYTGDYESNLKYYWNYVRKDERKLRIMSMVARINPRATLDSFRLINTSDISKPFHILYYATIPSYLEKEGKFFLLNLPEIKERFSFDYVSLSKRIYPLRFSTSEMIVDTYRIGLPQNFDIISLPEEFYDSTDLWILRGKYEKDKNNPNVIIYTDTYKRFGRYIPIKSYKRFRDALLRFKNFVSTPIVLQKKGGK